MNNFKDNNGNITKLKLSNFTSFLVPKARSFGTLSKCTCSNRHLIDITYPYPEFIVTLSIYICQIVSGKPQPLECEEIRWVKVEELHDFEFPTAIFPVRSLAEIDS